MLAVQPDVRAAVAQAQATVADGRALAVGGWPNGEATLSRQRRTPEAAGSYREWEAQLVRAMRLPGKQGLDREIGRHADIAASLRVDDAAHQAARRPAAAWMGWLHPARWWRARRRRSRHWSSRHAMRSACRVAFRRMPAANSTGWIPEAAQARADALAATAEAVWARQSRSPASRATGAGPPAHIADPRRVAGRGPWRANSSWHAAVRSESQTRTRCARIAWPPARAPTAGQIRASGCA